VFCCFCLSGTEFLFLFFLLIKSKKKSQLQFLMHSIQYLFFRLGRLASVGGFASVNTAFAVLEALHNQLANAFQNAQSEVLNYMSNTLYPDFVASDFFVSMAVQIEEETSKVYVNKNRFFLNLFLTLNCIAVCNEKNEIKCFLMRYIAKVGFSTKISDSEVVRFSSNLKLRFSVLLELYSIMS